jgi:hypothetical protein
VITFSQENLVGVDAANGQLLACAVHSTFSHELDYAARLRR